MVDVLSAGGLDISGQLLNQTVQPCKVSLEPLILLFRQKDIRYSLNDRQALFDFIRWLSFRLFLLRWLVEHFCSVEGIISVPSHRAESFHAKEHFCSVGTFTKMLLGTVMRPLLRSIRSASSSERNARLMLMVLHRRASLNDEMGKIT